MPGGMSADACGLMGCPEQTPPIEPVLIDLITPTRIAMNVPVICDLKGRDPVDSQGRHAYVVGFTIRGQFRITTAASNDAIPARELLGLFRNIYLEDNTGHQYLPGLEGRNLRDDVFFRNGAVDAWANGGANLGLNVGAQNNDLQMVLHFPFIRNERGGTRDLAGAISLRSLQARDGGALRFMMSSVGMNEAAGDPYDGSTFVGFQDTVRLYLQIAWLPRPIAPNRWQLNDYTDTALSGVLRNPERATEYCVVRHKIDDNGGESIADYGAVSVQRGSDTICRLLTLAQVQERDIWQLSGFDPRSDFDPGGERIDSLPYVGATLGAGFSISPANTNAFFLVPSVRQLKSMAAGRVSWKFESRTRTSSRFLHRTVLCHDAEAARQMFETVECGSSRNVIGVNSDGAPVSPSGMGTLVSQPSSRQQPQSLRRR